MYWWESETELTPASAGGIKAGRKLANEIMDEQPDIESLDLVLAVNQRVRPEARRLMKNWVDEGKYITGSERAAGAVWYYRTTDGYINALREIRGHNTPSQERRRWIR